MNRLLSSIGRLAGRATTVSAAVWLAAVVIPFYAAAAPDDPAAPGAESAQSDASLDTTSEDGSRLDDADARDASLDATSEDGSRFDDADAPDLGVPCQRPESPFSNACGDCQGVRCDDDAQRCYASWHTSGPCSMLCLCQRGVMECYMETCIGLCNGRPLPGSTTCGSGGAGGFAGWGGTGGTAGASSDASDSSADVGDVRAEGSSSPLDVMSGGAGGQRDADVNPPPPPRDGSCQCALIENETRSSRHPLASFFFVLALARRRISRRRAARHPPRAAI